MKGYFVGAEDGFEPGRGGDDVGRTGGEGGVEEEARVFFEGDEVGHCLLCIYVRWVEGGGVVVILLERKVTRRHCSSSSPFWLIMIQQLIIRIQ